MVLSGFFVGGMLVGVAIGFASGFASGVSTGVEGIEETPVKSGARTLLDIATVQDAERLVCLFGRRHYGGDEIADSLYNVYRAFPPDENTMKRLSLLHQKYVGTGGLEEYAVTLLYGITTDVLSSTIPTPHRSIPRTMSNVSKAETNMLPLRSNSCLALPDLQHR